MEITKDEFLEKYDISEIDFQEASISWDELQEIYEDYNSRQLEKLEEIRKDFMDYFLRNKEEQLKIRSFSSRCKDGEHLIAKIIRRRVKNYAKYKGLNKNNYMRFITDAIGIRGLLLYREDWVSFHEYLTREIPNESKYYIKDCIKDFNEDESFVYIAEAPKVHVRLGDYDAIYQGFILPDNIESNKHYRAIHYIIKYQGIYLEIQIKTLFEEGWGEIDHHILYPNKTGDKMLEEFSELLNRVSGLGDEMASFYYRLKDIPSDTFKGKEEQQKHTTEVPGTMLENEACVAKCDTVNQMILSVISE